MWVVTVAIGVLSLIQAALLMKLWFEVRALRRVPLHHPIQVAVKIVEIDKRLKKVEEIAQ